jgi:hypothetical protein
MSESDLTPRQAAAELGLSVKTLADWRYRSKQEGRQIGPRWMKHGTGRSARITYRRRDIEKYRTISEVDAA